MPSLFSDQQRLHAARRLAAHLAVVLDLPVSLRLWDDTIVPLGSNADPDRFFSVAHAKVIGAMLRRPSLETLYRLFACGHLDIHGADFIEFSQGNPRFQSREDAKVREAHPGLYSGIGFVLL